MKKTPEEVIDAIREACEELGWCIAMDESNEEVRGLIIGQIDYTNDIIDQIDTADNYSVYTSSGIVDPDFH